MGSHPFFVYILTSYNGNAMYIGITNDLQRRINEHKSDLIPGFTKRYRIHKLVYYESCTDVLVAIEREKQIKSWSRRRKNALVESMNPHWLDLYDTILD